MKKLDDFDEFTKAELRRCTACFTINILDIPEWMQKILPHAPNCSANPLLTEEESEYLT